MKVVFSFGVAALILSGAALSDSGPGATVPLLGVHFGDIDLEASDDDCAATVGGTCSTIAKGIDFVQRQIDVGGKSYIQTIITENGFESEDFVQIGFRGTGSVQGIASKLSVYEGVFSDAMASDGFRTDSIITAGWALEKAGVESNAVITVNVSEEGVTDGFVSKFNVDTDFNGTDNIINSLIADQTVILGAEGDKQGFYTEIKAASAASAEGGENIDGAGIGTASWAAGDRIQVVWVGQNINSPSVGAFGAQNVTNLDAHVAGSVNTVEAPSTSTTSFSSLTATGPFGTWNTEWTNTPTF